MKSNKKVSSKKTKKSPDEVISELITLRKVQQEALIKIKASVERKRMTQDVQKPNTKK